MKTIVLRPIQAVYLAANAVPQDIASPQDRPSRWHVARETADNFTLRRLNLAAPLGSYLEVVISKMSETIVGVER